MNTSLSSGVKMDEYKHMRSKPLGKREAAVVLDQATLLLAEMLPGCVVRHFAKTKFRMDSKHFMSFGETGPVMTMLGLNAGKYRTNAKIGFAYCNMLESVSALPIMLPVLPMSFIGKTYFHSVPLELGAEAIAKEFAEVVTKEDVQQAIADGTPEHAVSIFQSSRNPSSQFDFALYAIYLKMDQQGHNALRETIRLANEEGHLFQKPMIHVAEDYLIKLEVDADVLRQELYAVMEANWSRFRVVEI